MSLRRDPQDDLDALVGLLSVEEPRNAFLRHRGAAIGMFPGRGWTLTLFVGDTARYEPAHFLVIKRLDGRLVAELLTEQPRRADGTPFQQVDIEGPALAAYLARSDLDLSALDEVVASRWMATGPSSPPGK